MSTMTPICHNAMCSPTLLYAYAYAYSKVGEHMALWQIGVIVLIGVWTTTINRIDYPVAKFLYDLYQKEKKIEKIFQKMVKIFASVSSCSCAWWVIISLEINLIDQMAWFDFMNPLWYILSL